MSHPTHSIHSHSNPDASFHHTPVGTSSSTHAPGAVNVAAPAGPEDRQTLNTHSPAPTSTTSHTTTSAVPASTPSTTSHVVEPTQSHHHSHTAPEPRVEPTRSEPAGTSATPASTTSNADPSVASNASNAKGHENAGPTAADAPATAAKEHATRGESDVGVSGPEGGAGEVGEGGYPPQLHAGKVGLGPHYNEGGGLGDKIKGVEEVIKGKITHKPELVQQGHDRQTGALAQKARQADDNDSPFSRPDDGATEGAPVKETTTSDVRESGHAASASAGTASTKQQ